jgi:branched-chain amino acid transport system substrate-binding protein
VTPELANRVVEAIAADIPRFRAVPQHSEENWMKPIYRLPLGAAMAALTLLAAACGQGVLGGDDDAADETGPIVLGMPVPMSGSSAAIGPYMSNGAQLAIDEINEAGGVLDRQLELRVEDDACDPQTAVAAANKLVAAGVVASVGGYCSGATLPTLPVFGKQDVPMVIPAANSNELVAQELGHVFLINGTGNQQADAAIAWIERQDAGNVAILHDNTSYSKDIAEVTEGKLADAGRGVVVDAINPGESDYSANVNSVLSGEVDFVYWTGYYQEGGLLIRQFRQAGYPGPIMVADGAVDTTLAEIAGGDNAEGVYATMTQTADTIEGAEGWIATYEQTFGGEPGPYSPQSYDAVRVVAEAIKSAGSTDGKEIIAALEGLNGFELFSGPLTFTEDHTLSSGGFVILAVRDGEFVLEDPLA